MAPDSGYDKSLAKEILFQQFVEKISVADGQLIPLPGTKSKLGEPLFISARFGRDDVDPSIQFLNVDVFAKRGEDFLPVGIYDWEVNGDVAVGNKQRHNHLAVVNTAQQAADQYWSTGEAFHIRGDDLLKYAESLGGLEGMSKVRAMGLIDTEEKWISPIYQNIGIGSLMISTSAIVLEAHKISTLNLGTLSQDAQRAWKSFGRGDRTILSPREVSQHPKAHSSIDKFIT
jgi:hypothetical protein